MVACYVDFLLAVHWALVTTRGERDYFGNMKFKNAVVYADPNSTLLFGCLAWGLELHIMIENVGDRLCTHKEAQRTKRRTETWRRPDHDEVEQSRAVQSCRSVITEK